MLRNLLSYAGLSSNWSNKIDPLQVTQYTQYKNKEKMEILADLVLIQGVLSDTSQINKPLLNTLLNLDQDAIYTTEQYIESINIAKQQIAKEAHTTWAISKMPSKVITMIFVHIQDIEEAQKLANNIYKSAQNDSLKYKESNTDTTHYSLELIKALPWGVSWFMCQFNLLKNSNKYTPLDFQEMTTENEETNLSQYDQDACDLSASDNESNEENIVISGQNETDESVE